MSFMAELLEIKGEKPFLMADGVAIEGGGNYKGREYLIIFLNQGHRCGYVSLNEKEISFFKNTKGFDDYPYPNLNVHGGITFFGKRNIKISLKSYEFWIGFDASHYNDLPDIDKAEEYYGNNKTIEYTRRFSKEYPYLHLNISENQTHKTYDFMEKECFKIIDQLCELEINNELE